MRRYFRLILALLICQAAGGIGAVFTTTKVDAWYAGLIRPHFAPPDWVFGPVWTALFLMMGVAMWFVWEKAAASKEARYALELFLGHLVFNVGWSVLFFGFERPDLAFLEILFLLALIVVLTVRFWRIDRRAGILMVPYLGWVAFASLLNLGFWMLNV